MTLTTTYGMNGLIRRKVALELPHYLSRKPVLCHLAKRYGLVFSILGATVKGGRACFVLELEGRPSDHDSALRFLRELGARLETITERISVDKSRCTECGACIGICPANCFSRHPDTWEVRHDGSSCNACGECALVCPVRAISLGFALSTNGPESSGNGPSLEQVADDSFGDRTFPRKGRSELTACDRMANPTTG